MKIPYVIDNQTHRLADVLNSLLAQHAGRSVDVATAYFTIHGFGLVKDGLDRLGNFRLLLGAEPREGQHLGLRPEFAAVKTALTADLNREPFTQETLRLVEELIRFLRRDTSSYDFAIEPSFMPSAFCSTPIAQGSMGCLIGSALWSPSWARATLLRLVSRVTAN
ncbi:MAG: hypothetical protein C4293_04590 [Nitrospiraceae bacterium]